MGLGFNADVVFIDASGQVRCRNGDLTLRADDTGTRHIIVGSGVTFRPEADCGSLEPVDLGLDWLRWNTLYACSGNFLDRPTVNGSGVLLQGEAGGATAGVDSIEGLTGVVDLDSPDNSVNINVNAQAIEITTPGSGAPSGVSYVLVDYNDNDHLTDARKLSATSGVILDDQGARSTSGNVIKLDFDNEPASGEILSWGGSKLEWIAGNTNLTAVQVIRSTPFTPEQSFTDITFDSTQIETNPSQLEHNEGSPARIDIHVSGLYEIGFTGVVETPPATETTFGRVLVNNTTVVSGSEYHISPNDIFSIDTRDIPFSFSCITTLNPGDFITQQFATTDALLGVEIGSGMTLNIVKLDGVAGDKGEKGDPGGVAAGVDSVEGVSGVIDLDSPDNSVSINVDGQTIELTVLTALPDAGQTSVEGLSGVINLDSPDTSVDINVNGQTIELAASGVPDSFDDAVNLANTVIFADADVFEEYVSLATAIIPIGRYRIGWHAVYNYESTQRDPRMRIQLDGTNLIEETRMEQADGDGDQRIHVGGFAYTDFASAATHTIDMDFARPSTSDSFTIYEGRLEIWRVST